MPSSSLRQSAPEFFPSVAAPTVGTTDLVNEGSCEGFRYPRQPARRPAQSVPWKPTLRNSLAMLRSSCQAPCASSVSIAVEHHPAHLATAKEAGLQSARVVTAGGTGKHARLGKKRKNTGVRSNKKNMKDNISVPADGNMAETATFTERGLESDTPEPGLHEPHREAR